MAHPVIEEIGRVHTVDRIQVHAFRRWQRLLSTEVQPMLDELERLRVENAELKAQLQGWADDSGPRNSDPTVTVILGKEYPADVKRGPGRPRKAVAE
jgi:hypothetical protein